MRTPPATVLALLITLVLSPLNPDTYILPYLQGTSDKVKQGEKIALSGDSGASAGPHLHFDVTKDCLKWRCQTVAIAFINAKENPLKQGTIYEALAK